MEVINSAQIVKTRWSGGETKQLAIFPENATLEQRDFEWRISSAQVTDEESSFSDFTGYKRVLLSLNNTVELIHETAEGVLRYQLKPFETAFFDGSWHTNSKGKMIDFNVIYKPNYQPEMKVVRLDSSTQSSLELNAGFFYLINGQLRCCSTIIEPEAVVWMDQTETFEVKTDVLGIWVNFLKLT